MDENYLDHIQKKLIISLVMSLYLGRNGTGLTLFVKYGTGPLESGRSAGKVL